MEISVQGKQPPVQAFAALADPVRLSILERLRESDATITELSRELGVAPPSVSKHVSVLSESGFVTKHVEAQRRRCSLSAEGFSRLAEWSAHYETVWKDRLSSLDDVLHELEEG